MSITKVLEYLMRCFHQRMKFMLALGLHEEQVLRVPVTRYNKRCSSSTKTLTPDPSPRGRGE